MRIDAKIFCQFSIIVFFKSIVLSAKFIAFLGRRNGFGEITYGPCVMFSTTIHNAPFSHFMFLHIQFSIELIFGSSRTNMVGMSSSCMPHTFSVDSECVMFYHNKSQCLVFSFYVSTHKLFDRSYFWVQLEPQIFEYLFVLLISLLLHSIDQHCFHRPGLVWICFSESVFGLCFISLFPRAKAKQQNPLKKERGPFAPVISAKSAPPTHAPQSALAQVAGQGSSCVIRVLSLSWQGLGGLSLLRDLSTLDLSLVAGFGKPCLCPQ